MLKRFLKDSVLYGGANILSRGVLLLLLPLYTRVFTPGQFGMIELITVLGALVNMTVALEISQGMARHYAEAETDDEKVGYASTTLWFSLGAYALFMVAALAFAEPLSAWLLDDAGLAGVFRVAAIALALGGVFIGMQSQLRWQLKPRGYALTSLAYTAISALATIALIFGASLGVQAVFMGQILGGLVGIVVAAYFGREVYALRFDREKAREMLTFSLPLVPSSIAIFTTLYIDRLAIRALMSLAEVGFYGVGYRIASTVGLVLSGFQSALTPLIYQQHKAPETPAQLARIFRVFLALTMPLVLALSVFASEVLRLLATASYATAGPVIPVLALVFLFSNLYVFAPGLAIAKRTGVIATINGGSAVMNTVLNLTLIPRFGIMGACFASLASAVTAFVCFMVTSQRLYPVPHRWGRLGLAAAGMATLYGGATVLEARLGGGAMVAVKVLIAGLGFGWSIAVLLEPQELSRLTRRA